METKQASLFYYKQLHSFLGDLKSTYYINKLIIQNKTKLFIIWQVKFFNQFTLFLSYQCDSRLHELHALHMKYAYIQKTNQDSRTYSLLVFIQEVENTLLFDFRSILPRRSKCLRSPSYRNIQKIVNIQETLPKNLRINSIRNRQYLLSIQLYYNNQLKIHH